MTALPRRVNAVGVRRRVADNGRFAVDFPPGVWHQPSMLRIGRYRLAVPVLCVWTLLVPLRGVAQSDHGAPPRAPADVNKPAIPAGHEDLLAAMLGKDGGLPAGCALTDGDIQYSTVRATYRCAAGDVVVELVHPDEASASDTRTEQFALRVTSGSPPPELREALAGRIRARESAFTWFHPHIVEPSRVPGRTGILPAALLTVVVLAWLWRRRRARATRAA